MKASSFIFYLLLLLSLPLAAQTPPEGARVNKDRCLGYEMEYKKYPKPVIAQVQADMYQLYHLEAGWQADAAGKGKPLNDGILGPITWSWMQRFCKSFALDSTADVVAALPQRATQIATFSGLFNADAQTLVSLPFAQWVVKHPMPCGLDTKHILAQGSDADLQALLRCYQQPAPVAKPEPKEAAAALPRANTLYVFRANDFDAMEGAVATASTADEVIEKIPQENYPDKKTAVASIGAMLSSLSPEASKKITGRISKALVEKTRYQINDKVLNTLGQQGISNALFSELKKLSNQTFGSQKAFADAINAAIKKSTPEPQLQAQADTTSSVATAQPGAGSESSVDPVVEDIAAAQPSADKLLIQIQQASEQTYVELDKIPGQTLVKDKVSLAPVIIKILRSMQDIEYPTENLIQLAIKDKILKSSGICKLDKSNTVDNQLGNLTQDERKQLAELIDPQSPADANSQSGPLYCNEDHHDKLTTYFNGSLLKELQPLYIESMPQYEGKNILWTGGGEGCGCVPQEIQTMGYGIYPYWKAGAEAQKFDFSTLSRVAYFGLTARDDGSLAQIKAANGTPTLLDTKDNDARKFIREARRYGSKVDWIIEKEFALAPGLKGDKALGVFFANLTQSIKVFLSEPLTDPESRLRPFLSLGLAAQPTNGDGITFYFKNYPKGDEAEKRFEVFFTALKAELAKSDSQRDRIYVIKNHTYVNIMMTQDEFLASDFVFSGTNLLPIIKDGSYDKKNSSIPEIQEGVKSMLILLMEDPYYSALDEIYAVTKSTDRAVVAPLMFTDYSGLKINASPIDEREKRLSYIHESFGGGSFWPMIEYANSSEGSDYGDFNSYIGLHFAPGYDESYWNEIICGHRWTLIAIMNIWLLLAFAYLVSIFYLTPHRCKELPVYIRWLQHPLTVVIVLLPPIIIWGYLIAVDPLFTFINFSSLVGLIVLVLAIVAGIDAIKELKKLKPNRNLLQSQRSMSVPRRMPEANNSNEDDEFDDADKGDELK